MEQRQIGTAVVLSDAATRYLGIIGSPNGLQAFNALPGGSFSDVIVTDLFGYMPDGATAALRDSTTPRRVSAKLSGIAQRGKQRTITPGPEGLSLT